MLHSRLLASTLIFLVSGGAASASERNTPQPDFLPPAVLTLPSVLPAELIPPGFTVEFTERLANTDRRMNAADKAEREALLQFYAERRYEPIWTGEQGLTDAAQSVILEIGQADDWGLDHTEFQFPALASHVGMTRNVRADLDVEISLAVLKYARYARGGRADPRRISSNLDRKPRTLDPLEVIATAANNAKPDAYLRSLHPQHPQFEKLRQQYLAIKRGDFAGLVQPVSLTNGKKSQRAPARPQEAALLRVLLTNMEQWRWMPDDLGTYHVWVNIPEFTLRVMADGHVVHAERVVVGRSTTQTPIFSDEIQHVIFHPFWGVPDSIKTKELLPNLQRGNIDILARNNMRIQYRGRDVDPRSVDWSRADMRKFHVYQPPSADNALGIVKFRFPNSHAVYIHDTPSKKLFNAEVRAFSHGCMRLRDPVKLASLLLTQDEKWTAEKVNAVVRKGPKNNWIALGQKVPVHMTYFTVWVDDKGALKLFNDVYGHDARIASAIGGKAGTQVAAVRAVTKAAAERVATAPEGAPAAAAPARTERTARKRQPAPPPPRMARRSDRDWMTRVFNQ
jgi:murein L,D-transpeptidase YcbB/YkuD